MRFLCSVMCAMIVAPFVLCAAEPEQETLFSGEVEHGGYGCFVMKVSPMRDQTQLLLGGYGGWFINHTIMLGAGGYGMVSKLTASEAAPKLQGTTPDIGLGYGGFMVEYTHNSDKLLHVAGQLLIGAGGVGYTWSNQLANPNTTLEDVASDSFLVAEFGAQVEVNVASFFRLGLGGSYRYVSGVSLAGLTNKDLSGPSGAVTFKFGEF